MICMSLFQPTGTCGADFLPSNTTDSGTTDFREQVVLSPAFAGCGRLMSYNVTAVCGLQNQQECDIVFQLWRPTEPGRFALIKSALNGYTNPPPPYNSVHVSLSFPLDIEFAAGDMVGFFHNINGTRPLEVHMASADTHSYLQWSSVSTLRSLLTAEDAVTKTSRLPILNVEGNGIPWPSYIQCCFVYQLNILICMSFCGSRVARYVYSSYCSIGSMLCCFNSHSSMEPSIIGKNGGCQSSSI